MQYEKKNKTVFFIAQDENSYKFATAWVKKGLCGLPADMVELVDTLDLGSSAVRCVGSTPSIRTKLTFLKWAFLCELFCDYFKSKEFVFNDLYIIKVVLVD